MKRITWFLALMILLVGATGVVLPSMAAGGVGREITIVAKNMAFIIESSEPSEHPEGADIFLSKKALIETRHSDRSGRGRKREL